MEGKGVVNVKAYLETSQANSNSNSNNNAPEIRRFDLDQDVSTNFDYLRSKIASIYPSLDQQGFFVYWKDDESDLVAISSDEELIQAMLYGRPDGLLKIYIKPVADYTPPSEPYSHAGEPSNVEHPGVVCDSCDGSIRGLRFKCLVCTDYDLCSSCCEKGFHDHHYMLRLASPAPEWTGCGRGQHGAGAASWGWPGFGGFRSGGGAHGGWGGGAGGNMRRFWRNLMRSQQPDGCTPGVPGASRTGEPAAEPSAESSAEPQHADAQMTDAEREQHRDYLQHVGEQVSAMLEPLGVSVDVDVEERCAKRQMRGQGRCQGQGRGQGKGQGKCQGRRLGGKERQCSREGHCKPAEDCNKGGACGSTRCTRDDKCKPAEHCSRGGACMERDQPQTGNASGSHLPKSADLDSHSQSDDLEEAPPREDVDMDSSEDASWIKINPKSEDADMIVLEDTETAARSNSPSVHVVPALRLYPSLTTTHVRPKQGAPSAPPQPGTPEPTLSNAPGPSAPAQKSALEVKVAEAVEQMRAMGFHDDGGWMTSMLYENNGDLYKVIDSVLRAAQVSGSAEHK